MSTLTRWVYGCNILEVFQNYLSKLAVWPFLIYNEGSYIHVCLSGKQKLISHFYWKINMGKSVSLASLLILSKMWLKMQCFGDKRQTLYLNIKLFILIFMLKFKLQNFVTVVHIHEQSLEMTNAYPCSLMQYQKQQIIVLTGLTNYCVYGMGLRDWQMIVFMGWRDWQIIVCMGLGDWQIIVCMGLGDWQIMCVWDWGTDKLLCLWDGGTDKLLCVWDWGTDKLLCVWDWWTDKL